MDTTSTVAIYKGLTARLLDYVPPSGGSLRSRGMKMWAGGYAPDPTAYPYGVLRLINNIATAPAGIRLAASLELMLWGRGRPLWAERLEDYADVCDQAMHHMADPRAGGLVFTGARSRDTLPPLTEPVDREVVNIRCVYAVTIYPQFLTALGTPLQVSTT